MEQKFNVLGLIGMCLGILSIPMALFAATSWFMIIFVLLLGVGGLILSIIGRKQVSGKGMATAGMVCSIIGLAIWLIWVVIIGIIVGAASTASSYAGW